MDRFSNIQYMIVNQCDYTNFFFNLQYHNGVKIICFGNNASLAMEDVPHFKMPHPSGRNRQINNKEFIDKKINEARKFLEGK